MHLPESRSRARRVPDGMPRSAGALVDRAGLKGGASAASRVSPTHANFIVNEGGATAADIRALIEACRARCATGSASSCGTRSCIWVSSRCDLRFVSSKDSE